MAIPLALLTLTVQRTVPTVGDDGIYDPYDPQTSPSTTTVAIGVRATIGQPSANVALSGGDRVVYSATFDSDPCPMLPGDLITDSTGTTWTCLFARTVRGLGLDHTAGELRMEVGAN
jgi:hypothetical protein